MSAKTVLTYSASSLSPCSSWGWSDSGSASSCSRRRGHGFVRDWGWRVGGIGWKVASMLKLWVGFMTGFREDIGGATMVEINWLFGLIGVSVDNPRRRHLI